MKNIHLVLVFALAVLIISSVAFAKYSGERTPVEFYKGHSHIEGKTINAPQHSGGTDRRGCHNASVPYHCH